MNQEYVVGFAFNVARTAVALIRKKNPRWQAGLLNGIGGKVETTDPSFVAAQAREFKEETGVDIPAEQWRWFATLQGQGYVVRCYWAVTDDVLAVETKTEEEVVICAVDESWQLIGENRKIPNLSYLIPLALDHEHKGTAHFLYY